MDYQLIYVIKRFIGSCKYLYVQNITFNKILHVYKKRLIQLWNFHEVVFFLLFRPLRRIRFIVGCNLPIISIIIDSKIITIIATLLTSYNVSKTLLSTLDMTNVSKGKDKKESIKRLFIKGNVIRKGLISINKCSVLQSNAHKEQKKYRVSIIDLPVSTAMKHQA